MPKNWCFWIVVLEKTLENALICKEIQPFNPQGNQPWIFIGRTDPEAETPILWPPDRKNWLIRKDSDAGKDWRWEEKGTTEDEMVGWHYQLDGHEFEQGPGVGDGQGGLACCSPWGLKEWDATEQLNWTICILSHNGKIENSYYLCKPWKILNVMLFWQCFKFESHFFLIRIFIKTLNLGILKLVCHNILCLITVFLF